MQRCHTLATNGHVYETFGISKHFPVKLQELLKRAETLDNSLTAKCFIYDVSGWLSFIRIMFYLFVLLILEYLSLIFQILCSRLLT